METQSGDGSRSDDSAPSPQSEAVANELQELSLQPAPNLLPIRERKNVLQLKLQQRRTREELVSQGIMPPLKSSANFHEQRRSLERARTEDYLKRKIKARPQRAELIRMHILEETSAEPSLQARQLQLKRARLTDELNDKISHRPGPMELIHKNILAVHSSIKQAIIETDFPKGSGENSSFDEDSNDSLSPEQPLCQESPLDLGSLPSPTDTQAGNSVPSPTQFLNQAPPPAPPLPPVSGSPPSQKLTNGTAAPGGQRTATSATVKSQPKTNSDRSAQRPKKPKDSKPKIKKLKYHQYIPPDQKGDKEPPPPLDSSYAKILQQQQLFLQLQILNQQKQHYNYHTILPAPSKSQTDQQRPASSSSISTSDPSPAKPTAAPSTATSNQSAQSRQSSAPTAGTKPTFLPPNLDEMKVAELKAELKLRSLPVSGTKNNLIERLTTYQELNGGAGGGGGGGVGTSSSTAGGATGPEAGGAGGLPKSHDNNNNTTQQHHQHHTSLALLSAPPQQLLTFGSTPPGSPTPSDRSVPTAVSPQNTGLDGNTFGEMVTSPLTQLSLRPSSTPRLSVIPTTIKDEPHSSTPGTQQPCEFYGRKASSLHKHSQAPLTASSFSTAVDKDRMLQEKDKQIEELTRMLRQKQRLVEALRLQLEHGKKGGKGAISGGEGAVVAEPVALVKIKEEPPDISQAPPSSPSFFSSARPPSFSPPTPPPPAAAAATPAHPPTSIALPTDVIKVTIKQEAVEMEEEDEEEDLLTSRDSQTRATQEQSQLQTVTEHTSAQTQLQQQQLRLQQTALQLAQQHAIETLLLQQQLNLQNRQQKLQNHNQTFHNQHNLQNQHQTLQKRSQQRKKKSHKQQLKQQQQLLQSQQQSKQQHQQQQQQQQLQLKQQILLKQQQTLLLQQQVKQLQQQQQQPRQQQPKQPQQQVHVQTKAQLKQQQLLQVKQQLLMQQKLQAQQQQHSQQQVSQLILNQQSGFNQSFPLDLLKTGSTPTLVTDSNGNHFLIALTNHMSENQASETPENKVTNHITLQRLQSTPTKLPSQCSPQLPSADTHSKLGTPTKTQKVQNRKVQKAGLEVPTEQSQQEVSQSFSAPPSLQPFFLDEETGNGKDILSPTSQTEELCPGLDQEELFSPLSPASIKTAVSSPDDKENAEHMDDLFDILVQTGEISSSFKSAPDPSLACFHPSFRSTCHSSPPPSPLQLVLSPPSSPPADLPQQEPQPPPTATEEEEEEDHLKNSGKGRLEDFLESTTGKPLLGAEPGGPMTLIDDLHSQMLSTPSILDHPSSPMDTYDLGYDVSDASDGVGSFGGQTLDSMDWLDLTMVGRGGEETRALAPLGPPTPPSVFSADFLDSSDLQIHWDSCL